jgi:hypothetical protein
MGLCGSGAGTRAPQKFCTECLWAAVAADGLISAGLARCMRTLLALFHLGLVSIRLLFKSYQITGLLFRLEKGLWVMFTIMAVSSNAYICAFSAILTISFFKACTVLAARDEGASPHSSDAVFVDLALFTICSPHQCDTQIS